MSESLDDRRGARIVRRSTTSFRAKLCPRCLSPLKEESNLLGWLAPREYICSKCGYRGPVFVESDQSVLKGQSKTQAPDST